LQDAAPNQWTFALDVGKQLGKVLRCAGKDCGPPFEVLVRRSPIGEIFLWEPIANEAFAFSGDQRVLTHSQGSNGHVTAEFGHCVPQF
jgi:hypothetical protein